MDQSYLQELILETNNRGGGIMLSYNNSPAVVVLTVDKYNELMAGRADAGQQSAQEAGPAVAEEGKKLCVLVTGGAGYIGAHTVRRLLQDGHRVVVVDNLSTGKKEHVAEGAVFLEGDLADVNFLRDVFAAYAVDAVMHFAASIEVEESVSHPERYFENNVVNTQKLLSVMAEAGVRNIVFSSTAAVYGDQHAGSISENARLQPNNPYGYTKLLCERTLKYYAQYLNFRVVVFRYFNACGCDFDGAIQSSHQSHLIPLVMQAAAGKRAGITVYGTDYSTHDGSAVRDYVHVLDIARAHVHAVGRLADGQAYQLYNIGTGRGCSVLEIVNKTSEVLNRIIPMEIGPRRAGDAEITVADNSKMTNELGFHLLHSDLETIITTSWNAFQNKAA